MGSLIDTETALIIGVTLCWVAVMYQLIYVIWAMDKNKTISGWLSSTVFPITRTIIVENSQEDTFKAIIQCSLAGGFLIDDLDIQNFQMVLSVKPSNNWDIYRNSYLYKIQVNLGENENVGKSVIHIGLGSKFQKKLQPANMLIDIMLDQFEFGLQSSIYAYGHNTVNAKIQQAAHPATEIICLKCGNVGLPTDRYCPKCGSQLN